jgi:hypothetical protein
MECEQKRQHLIGSGGSRAESCGLSSGCESSSRLTEVNYTSPNPHAVPHTFPYLSLRTKFPKIGSSVLNPSLSTVEFLFTNSYHSSVFVVALPARTSSSPEPRKARPNKVKHPASTPATPIPSGSAILRALSASALASLFSSFFFRAVNRQPTAVAPLIGLRLTAYGLRLTAYGLRLKPYTLLLTSFPTSLTQKPKVPPLQISKELHHDSRSL